MLKTLYISNRILTEDTKYTFLSANVAAAVDSLTVDSIIGFSTDQILLIGGLGSESFEIIKTHASTPPGSTITLASNLTFAHLAGTKVYIIPYNKIEISHADTKTGSKTVLETIAIQADQEETQYTDEAETGGYYFSRFVNDIPTPNTYSDYSDPIPYGGFATNTVSYIIQYAMQRHKITSFTDNITHEFCIDEINSYLAEITGRRKKWSNLQEFDYTLGQLTKGEWRIALPSNMYQYSNKSILAIHYAGEKNFEYRDEREWNDRLEGVVYTTISTGASTGAISITLTDSTDFDSSGTVMIAGQLITYTANNSSTNVLSGIPASGTGSIVADISSGAYVWQGDYEEGRPEIYTIKEGYAYFYPLVSSAHAGNNVYADYWKNAPKVDSDADTIDFDRFDMVKFGLTASIRWQLKNDGIPDLGDGDYLRFRDKLKNAAGKEAQISGQKFKMRPSLNRILY